MPSCILYAAVWGAAERAALAANFAASADQAERQPGAPWRALAADLRAWAARLRAAG